MVVIVNLLIIACAFVLSWSLVKQQEKIAQRIQKLNEEYGVSQKKEN